MARLVLLNGAPAAGKSTLARCYVGDHPLALGLDVDVVRSMLGGWLQRPEAAGLAARALALEMARTHLGAGRDVVVPQFLARARPAEQLEDLASQTRSAFAEVVVDVDPEQMLERFARRSAQAARIEHRDAADLLGAGGGERELLEMRERMLVMLAGRPRVRWVASREGDVEATYRDLLAVLG